MSLVKFIISLKTLRMIYSESKKYSYKEIFYKKKSYL